VAHRYTHTDIVIPRGILRVAPQQKRTDTCHKQSERSRKAGAWGSGIERTRVLGKTQPRSGQRTLTHTHTQTQGRV